MRSNQLGVLYQFDIQQFEQCHRAVPKGDTNHTISPCENELAQLIYPEIEYRTENAEGSKSARKG